MKKYTTSNVLTVISILGVIGTGVMAAKETPKAIRLLREEEELKGEKLTKAEIIKIAAPAYIPSIIIGVSTVACIIGGNILNRRQQASLMSAYALLDRSYREYRNKVNDIYGENADEQIKDAMEKENVIEEVDMTEDDITDDIVTFFDFNNLGYFEARISDVLQKTTLEGGMECYIINLPN